MEGEFMENFKNLYSISKTLRFELRPYGKTLENFQKSGLLEKDAFKANNRRRMQAIIDEKFKEIIEERLKYTEFSEYDLENITSKDKKTADKAAANLKKQVIASFDDEIFNDYLKPDKNIDALFKNDPANPVISTFKGFTTYFVNFFEIRKHIFKGESSGSIAYRIIDENLTTYLNNIEKIKKLPEELKLKLEGINQIDKLSNYNDFLTQSGITHYNEIIGGISKSEDVKIQGINEKINLYCQKNKVKLPRLTPLYKMILSDRVSNSFVLDTIENDTELIEMISDLINKTDISQDIILSDIQNIFIKYEQLGNLPGISYSSISNAICLDYDTKFGDGKRKKSYENDRKKHLESDVYSINYISELLMDTDVVSNIKDRYKELTQNYQICKDNFNTTNWMAIQNIKQSEKTNLIKDLLDVLKSIQRFYDLFDIVDEDKNPSAEFYPWLSKNAEKLDFEFNSAYNKARNYLTKKQYSDKKFKLNFDSPTLAKGWDANKEIDNSTFIMRKFNNERGDYDYFLGIWNKSTPANEKIMPLDDNGLFEKMQYKLYPDPSKMLPKQFLSKTWKSKYPTTPEFDKKYKEGRHKKGPDFEKEFLHELIDWFKHGLVNHDERYQDVFGFKLRNTEDYDAYTEFLEDVERCNYNLSFNKIADISNLINDGKLYVFQIWSKDFSVDSKGTKNLNTIYFESLFSEENMIEKIFKLSGEAEIFYRPASLNYCEDIIKKGHHHAELKDKFDYPIIKDKRYSQDKFFFHVPIVINYSSEKLNAKGLNNRINENLGQFKHIIGIDRGERHLIYLTVVDISTGEIVEQKHLDEIINTDTRGVEHKTHYLNKLEEKSKTRDNERKSWEAIETIKELKEGYISHVINEIQQLQEKYNALIVMENLNYGFKNSRIKVEKQVYQKFETALIKKFNYIIDKNNPETYIHGYQLTNPITTLDQIGNQSGIVLYIPAWNTSKIDPVTGFVNLLYADDLKYKNQEQAKSFIEKIDNIYFENGEFKFDIDFSKWNSRYSISKTKWTLTSYGTRIHTFRNPHKNNQWDSVEYDLTEEFKLILNTDGTLKSQDVETYKKFMSLFKLMLQLRNSVTGTDIDYMISPVADKTGANFDSRKNIKNLPVDADANGAYNIARKGVMAIENIMNGISDPLKISNEDYLKYIQSQQE